ncbi:unnamed protein product [Dibothriocephalus latus]|uniref:MIT domain-containing protein n=1 Tax=Dibothriocephalus latus TaxID=60516 RepID=A0A3P7NWS6_DIBLA|nr:unnamed protein product [Dibothriocephalus latus]
MSDNQLISIGAGLITRALEFEEKSKLTESLVCYEEGIALLIKGLRLCTGLTPFTTNPFADKDLKCNLKAKIESYMTRAEGLKELIKKQTAGSPIFTVFFYQQLEHIMNRSAFLKVIRVLAINDCSDGFYNMLEKFSHFCEIVISSPSPVQKISLTTGQNPQVCKPLASRVLINPTEQLEKLRILQQDLHARNVTFEWTFSSALHDRKIW